MPQGQRWRLLATFNSGFTYKDGHGGFAVNGETYTPFTKGLGTLVVTKSGRVDVVSWNGGSTVSPRIVAARQNLPLIVSGGKPNPNLNDGPAWGYTLGNAIRVWRSGVGIDKHGNLIYAAADYQTVSTLADILIRAGAVRAMELDINAEWPSFITYGHFGARDPVKLVPNGQQSVHALPRPGRPRLLRALPARAGPRGGAVQVTAATARAARAPPAPAGARRRAAAAPVDEEPAPPRRAPLLRQPRRRRRAGRRRSSR